MSETTLTKLAEPPHSAANYIRGQGLGRPGRELAARAGHHPAPRAGAAGRADRRALLRRLPLGPAPGAQRVAEHHADRLSLRPGPRDRRPGDEGGRRRPKFKEGDLAAVGCMVDSCRTCPACREGQEQFCEGPATFTYNSPDKHLGGVTYGGYSDSIVVDEAFALRVPDRLDPAGAAPLLCAGITTYSPLAALERPERAEGRRRRPRRARAHGREARQRVRRPRRRLHDVARQDGGRGPAGRPRRRGLQERRGDAEAPRQLRLHPRHGLGRARRERLPRPAEARRHADPGGSAGDSRCRSSVFSLLFGRRRLAGSIIGGIRETQEMLDFCAEHGITADVEVIPIQKINEAYERLAKGDVKYRFVIDMASLK